MLYPVYALLFADSGRSTAEISSLFALWSITSVVLEVPSGILADATSRRLLLAVAPLLTASGYALWIFAPSYAAFAAGFALWGLMAPFNPEHSRPSSTRLERVGAAARYPAVMGRASAWRTGATATATGIAAPVLSAGGFTASGSRASSRP